MSAGVRASRVVGVLFSFLTVSTLALAQPVEVLGTRALGMGGAFVAVADDASATYWNPAGLATGAFVSVVLDGGPTERGGDEDSRRPGEPAREGTAAFAGVSMPSLGVSFYRLSDTRVGGPVRGIAGPGGLGSPIVPAIEATSLTTYQTAVTLVQSLGDHVAVGTSLKYVHASASAGEVLLLGSTDPLDAAADLETEGSDTFDLDVGVMAFSGPIRLGLVARNLRKPSFETPSGTRLALDRQVRTGVAWLPRPTLLVSVDADLTRTSGVDGRDRSLAAGTEWWVLPRRVAVRGGLRVSTIDDARPAGAGGVTVQVARMLIDAQFTHGGDDGPRGWSLAGRFHF